MKRFIKFVKSLLVGHELALLLVALVLVGSLFIEVSKKHEAELERQRAAEMLEIERDNRYNDSLIN